MYSSAVSIKTWADGLGVGVGVPSEEMKHQRREFVFSRESYDTNTEKTYSNLHVKAWIPYGTNNLAWPRNLKWETRT